MRVVLVGRAGDRARLRARLAGTNLGIVGEFATIDGARASGIRADAMLLAAEDGVPPRPSDGAPADVDAFDEPLTPREIEVLERLAEGLPNKTIADRLGISDQTVKFHIASIAGKLGAANRTDIVRRAVRLGLISL